MHTAVEHYPEDAIRPSRAWNATGAGKHENTQCVRINIGPASLVSNAVREWPQPHTAAQCSAKSPSETPGMSLAEPWIGTRAARE